MNNRAALGSWIRRFLMEYLVGERNLARNTQQSYRDAVRLLVVFTAAKTHKKVDELLIPDIDADLLRAFLRHIEEKRKCSVSSRNQRLAAIHALAGFIAERCPEYLDWCAQLRTVKSKRSAPMPVCYLEKPEIDALLDAPSPVTKLGSRDRALLLFLYNSGARADEAAKLCIEDLSLHSGADGALSSVCLHGKGGKVRICPLWISTTAKLTNLVAGRNGKERVFLNRLLRAAHTLRHPRHRDAICERRHEPREGDAQETNRPSYHPPHHRHASSSRRCRHQHHPRLARPRLNQYHQHLRRN